ncbi:hypothetical protein ACFQ2B_33330 [Streptomyces stramineus]
MTPSVGGNPLGTVRALKDKSLMRQRCESLGGTGTVLGRGVGDREWADALARAAEDRYIVQELVTPSPEAFPDPGSADGRSPWALNWGAFLIGRQYAGAFLRGLPAGRADVISFDNKAYAGCVFQAPDRAPAPRTAS